ncbi:MAG: hypothetical protein DRG66_03330 [Deltaproteobacteria bacterium]|jgi:hypothetical protein|nr:MAG: hypothetical protein DRG66_03330 [Deltaproteobacteria bacterium]
MKKKKPKDEEDIGIEEAFRSLGKFFSWLEGRISPSSEFREHMDKSRVEFLKGIRVLIDKRINDLEKRQPKKAEKKATRVKVE